MLPEWMRAAALLLGLCIGCPAPFLARAEPACNVMMMPPEHLREISRGFGHGHTGIDLMAPLGSPVRAAAAGTVMYAGWYYDYGNIVDIRHRDGLITRYAHLLAFAPGIAPGVPVAAGAAIARVGATGNAHGPHVHFEVRVDGYPVDPKPYLALAPCHAPAPEPLEAAEAPAPNNGRHDH